MTDILTDAFLYLQLLEEATTSGIEVAIENDIFHYDVILQHDGAPLHTNVPVRKFLDEEFFGRWIGQRGLRLRSH